MEVLEQIDLRLYPVFARTFQHLTLELGAASSLNSGEYR
jgi:hypothetical protein